MNIFPNISLKIFFILEKTSLIFSALSIQGLNTEPTTSEKKPPMVFHILLVSFSTDAVASVIPSAMDRPPSAAFPPVAALFSSSTLVIWSNPARVRLSSFAAPLADERLSAVAAVEPPSLSAEALAAFMLSAAESPLVKAAVKAAKAFAATISFSIIAFSHFTAGLSTFINPSPIAALKVSNCSDSTLTWFAQLSEVLIKSPAAFES